MYSEWIFNQSEDEVENIGLLVNGRRMNDSRYADYTLLIAENIEDVTSMLEGSNKFIIRMKANTSNTKSMNALTWAPCFESLINPDLKLNSGIGFIDKDSEKIVFFFVPLY